MLRSDLCDFSGAYIVKWFINAANPNNDAYDKKIGFKNNAPFVSCFSKINNTHIDNAEDLDIVMPMYNLLEYNKNYSKTAGNFWNSIKDSKSFNYKTSITGKLEGCDTEKEAEIVVPLKHLSNFWKTLDMPLMNCEINLILTWSKNCVLTSNSTIDANPDADPAAAAINNPTNATFKITDTKLYVPVVTLSIENDKALLEQLRTGFKRTIKWNKHRSEMTIRLKVTT